MIKTRQPSSMRPACGLRLKMMLPALALMSAAAGCSTTVAPASDSICVATAPLRFSRAAVLAMDDADTQMVEAHNLAGKRLCGWNVH